jgi:hypothetical protein
MRRMTMEMTMTTTRLIAMMFVCRWGRNMEVPSEDPLLNGLFGAEYSLGLQYGQDPR